METLLEVEHVLVEVEILGAGRNLRVRLIDQCGDGQEPISAVYVGDGDGFDNWPRELERNPTTHATTGELRDWLRLAGHGELFEPFMAAVSLRYRRRQNEVRAMVEEGTAVARQEKQNREGEE